jgi:hypothetical protein
MPHAAAARDERSLAVVLANLMGAVVSEHRPRLQLGDSILQLLDAICRGGEVRFAAHDSNARRTIERRDVAELAFRSGPRVT